MCHLILSSARLKLSGGASFFDAKFSVFSCTFVPLDRLTQMKAERERSKTEMKDLQQQLSEMHDELDQAKKAEVINSEKEILLKVNETT